MTPWKRLRDDQALAHGRLEVAPEPELSHEGEGIPRQAELAGGPEKLIGTYRMLVVRAQVGCEAKSSAASHSAA